MLVLSVSGVSTADICPGETRLPFAVARLCRTGTRRPNPARPPKARVQKSAAAPARVSWGSQLLPSAWQRALQT